MASKDNNSDTIKTAMISALEQCLGIVSDACKSVGISRQTHYRWCIEDEEYKASVEDINEITIDFVEGKLHTLIKEGDTAATLFYLKTKAKKRGYVERQEIQHDGTLGIMLVEGNTDPADEPIKD